MLLSSFVFLILLQTLQKQARAPACQSFREHNKNTLINSINQHGEGRLIGRSACAKKKLMELRWVKITIISGGDHKNIVAKTGSNQAYNNWHVKPRWENGADTRLADKAPRPFKEASSLSERSKRTHALWSRSAQSSDGNWTLAH